MGDFTEIHRTSTARQLFGEQPEAADRLGRGALRFSVVLCSLGVLTEEFFVFVEKIKATCVSLLLPPMRGGQKSRPGWLGRRLCRPGYKVLAHTLSTAHNQRRTRLLPHSITYRAFVKSRTRLFENNVLRRPALQTTRRVAYFAI